MFKRQFFLRVSLILAVLGGTRPVSAQYRICWGDMHGHTAISDGKGSLDDYFTHARDVAKLDFVVVSDHDFGNSAPWRMPKETWTLTQAKADQYTAGGKFVAIAGYEWTSQPKYWTPEEPLFTGPVKYYGHKNAYFPSSVDYLFSAKDPAYNSPNLLAEAVMKHGGRIHNNHPAADIEGRDQFDYAPRYYSVIVNTEIWPDTIQYKGKTHSLNVERTLREFLNKGGKTGFVGSTDTHDGKPAAKTAVLAKELTRPAIFDALRHRRNYAVFNARIVLDFKIEGHVVGEEIEISGNPRIVANVQGTDKIQEIVVVRDGAVIHTRNPRTQTVRFDFVDSAFAGNSYYYMRVIQADKDEYGNPSHAWSSPIWVKTNTPLPAQEPNGVILISPPEQGFFSKKVVYQGISIKAHKEVDDRALLEARRRLAEMLGSTPEIVQNLVEVGAELHIIGKDQNTSDLPSERHWKGKPFEKQGNRSLTIDERTRGVGGLPASCGEENLLKLSSDRYRDHRDICRHEFAHTVFDYGLSPDVRAMVEKQYAASVKKGLWKTAYASTNTGEYFAELTMWYFGSRGDYGRIEPRPKEGQEWLRKYDSDGFALVNAIYSGKQTVQRILWKPLVAHPAKEEAELRPSPLVQPTSVLFDNRTSTDVWIYWIDPKGQRKPYGIVRAGQKHVRPKFTTHAWVVVKPDGKVLGIWVADARPGKAVVE